MSANDLSDEELLRGENEPASAWLGRLWQRGVTDLAELAELSGYDKKVVALQLTHAAKRGECDYKPSKPSAYVPAEERRRRAAEKAAAMREGLQEGGAAEGDDPDQQAPPFAPGDLVRVKSSSTWLTVSSCATDEAGRWNVSVIYENLQDGSFSVFTEFAECFVKWEPPQTEAASEEAV